MLLLQIFLFWVKAVNEYFKFKQMGSNKWLSDFILDMQQTMLQLNSRKDEIGNKRLINDSVHKRIIMK